MVAQTRECQIITFYASCDKDPIVAPLKKTASPMVCNSFCYAGIYHQGLLSSAFLCLVSQLYAVSSNFPWRGKGDGENVRTRHP